MADVTQKRITHRELQAIHCEVNLSKEAYMAIKEGEVKKRVDLRVSQIAGITGSEQTLHLIPINHTLSVESIDAFVNF